MALAPTRGQTLANLEADPFGPRLRNAAAARSTSRGLCGETSSRRLVLVPSDPMEQLKGALARANPQKAEPRSCMILELKPMGKLITLDKYLSVRLNQGLTRSSDSNLWEKLITLDKYLSVRLNQGLAWSSDSNLWEN